MIHHTIFNKWVCGYNGFSSRFFISVTTSANVKFGIPENIFNKAPMSHIQIPA